MRALFFDTETGGLDSRVHSVFSVGALVGDLDTGEIIESFECYHRLPSIEDYVYTPKAIEIHGITPQQAFEEGVPTEEIQTKFMDLWTDHGAQILGGHNANPFDRNMMAHRIYGVEVNEFDSNFTYRYVDTMPIIRVCLSSTITSGASLGQATKFFGIDMNDHGKDKYHAALFDSIAAFRVAHKFRSVVTQPDVVERLKA